MSRILLIALFLSLLPGSLPAYNNSYEQRIVKQLLENYPEEELIRLRAGSREFVALYRPHTTPEVEGAVILVHAMGAHPDWPDVIYPLRVHIFFLY